MLLGHANLPGSSYAAPVLAGTAGTPHGLAEHILKVTRLLLKPMVVDVGDIVADDIHLI